MHAMSAVTVYGQKQKSTTLKYYIYIYTHAHARIYTHYLTLAFNKMRNLIL